MSKFIRVQIVEEEVFKIPADWDLKDITYRSGELFYKGKAYTNLQSIQIESMNDCEIFLEDDDENEMYMDAMPDEEEPDEEEPDEEEPDEEEPDEED